MAILRYKDISKMDAKEKEVKLKDLRLELVKASVTANKQNAKPKEIKKSIAKLLTFNKSNTGVKVK